MLTTPEAIREALTEIADDQVAVIHGMADIRGLDASDLTIEGYYELIVEEAKASVECAADDDLANQVAYADKLFGVANRIRV